MCTVVYILALHVKNSPRFIQAWLKNILNLFTILMPCIKHHKLLFIRVSRYSMVGLINKDHDLHYDLHILRPYIFVILRNVYFSISVINKSKCQIIQRHPNIMAYSKQFSQNINKNPKIRLPESICQKGINSTLGGHIKMP